MVVVTMKPWERESLGLRLHSDRSSMVAWRFKYQRQAIRQSWEAQSTQ